VVREKDDDSHNCFQSGCKIRHGIIIIMVIMSIYVFNCKPVDVSNA